MTLKHFLWYQLPSKTETIAENIHLTRTIFFLFTNTKLATSGSQSDV